MKHKQWKAVYKLVPLGWWWQTHAMLEVAGIPKEKITAKIENNQLVVEGHSSYRYVRYEIGLDYHPSPNTLKLEYKDGLLLLEY